MGWGWEDRSKREGERREGGLLGREMGVWLVEREREGLVEREGSGWGVWPPRYPHEGKWGKGLNLVCLGLGCVGV